MKRIIFIFIIIVAGFLYFSFFIEIDNKEKDNLINIYIDKDLENLSLLKLYFYTRSSETGINIRIFEFSRDGIDSVLLFDKNGAFISDKKLHSNLYGMKYLKLSFICFPTVSHYSSKYELSLNEFKRLINLELAGIKSYDFKKNISFKSNNLKPQEVKIGFLDSLSLSRRFLKLEGHFPTIINILDGRYNGIFKGYVSFNDMGNKKRVLNNLITDDLKTMKERGITIIGGGDLMLSRGVANYLKQFGRDYPFGDIKSYIKKADISFANLESPLTHSNNKFFSFNKGIYFRAEPENVYSIADAGFDVFSLANNHIFDWGTEGVISSILYLNKVGIKWTGVGNSLNVALKPAKFFVKNTRIGFIACNDIYPTKINDSGKTMIMPTVNDLLQLNICNKYHYRYNVLVVSVHGGVEYKNKPKTNITRKYRMLADNGADIIFGSHPHVIQGVEIYRNKVIAYSLGNLVFDQDWSTETSTGLLLEVGIINNSPVYFFPVMVYIDKSRPKIIQTGAYNFFFPQKSKGGVFYAKK